MIEARAKRDPDLRDEYDFSNGVRGKYAPRLAADACVVVLEPDVAKEFRDSAAVNEALRLFLRSHARAAAKRARGRAKRSKR